MLNIKRCYDVINSDKIGEKCTLWLSNRPKKHMDGLDSLTAILHPTFSHYRWNQHNATALLLPRSSNIAEGWHHGFRIKYNCRFTVYYFMDYMAIWRACRFTVRVDSSFCPVWTNDV